MVKNMQEIYIHDTFEDVIYYVTAVENIDTANRTTITSYPTTEGANINDHAYNEPKTITLSFGISEYNDFNGFYYRNSDNSKTNLSYDETRELIKTWDKQHTILNLQTLNDRYNNLLISGYNLPEASELGVLNYRISLQEVRLAKIKTITVPIEKSISSEDQVNDNGEIDVGTTAANILGTVGSFSTVGALIGTAIGGLGVGTVVGAGIGAVVGTISGFFKWITGD